MSPSSSTLMRGGSSAGEPAGQRMRTSSWTPSNRRSMTEGRPAAAASFIIATAAPNHERAAAAQSRRSCSQRALVPMARTVGWRVCSERVLARPACTKAVGTTTEVPADGRSPGARSDRPSPPVDFQDDANMPLSHRRQLSTVPRSRSSRVARKLRLLGSGACCGCRGRARAGEALQLSGDCR